MQLESKKYLYDIAQAAKKVSRFIGNKNFNHYKAEDLLKSGVERQFEIMGEALNQLSKIDKACIENITDYQQIISFRNILIHGYAEVDDRLVWNIIESKLPTLLQDVKFLLDE